MSSVYKRAYQNARKGLGSIVRYVGAKRGSLYVDSKHDLRDTVLVAGSGRSGTTWLAEIINYRNNFRDIFEPFWAVKLALCKDFAGRQYLRPFDDDPKFLGPARLILSGQIRNDWTDQFNRRVICDKRLIKDIRINLLLKWIRWHFPELPMVLILRHPCAVVSSRLQLGWKAKLDDLLCQEALVADHLVPFLPAINEAQSDFEKHLMLWCIENFVPLRQLGRGEAHVVFYEDLCNQPEVEVLRLAQYLKIDFTESMLRRVRRPSSQTRKRRSAIVTGENPVASWKNHVSEELTAKAVRALELFGLSWIYAAQPDPLVQADLVLKD